MQKKSRATSKRRELGPEGDDVQGLFTELSALRNALTAAGAVPKELLDAVHENYRDSARNLVHYLVLRRHDLRPLQLRLAALGLSSLGRAESSVLSNVDAVLDILRRLTPHADGAPRNTVAIDLLQGQRLLAEHTGKLLGPPDPARGVRIMVTMPSEAASDYMLVHNLLQQGMNCMRINCAHDDAAAWAAMIDNLRRAERALGRSCRVAMDLAGPKLRTGPLEPGPAVIRIHPPRDVYGRITAPARVWLTPLEAPRDPPTGADACLTLPEQWLTRCHVGEWVKFTDARDGKRGFRVVDVTQDGCWAEAEKTCYIVPETTLRHDDRVDIEARDAIAGELASRENALSLSSGDSIVMTRDLRPGRPATLDSDGRVLTPAHIGCTIPEVFDNVRPGEPIWFDDGAIGGVVENVASDRVLVRITRTHVGGTKLRADKGINLPESDLSLEAMTGKDLEDLSFAARHADLIELSFANTAHDVELLQRHLKDIEGPLPGIVLKIETRRGFANLPEMLLTAMRWPSCGVMIARGDLAVECGFERLAEVQEEILWICEAAHIPVIWATQVLENLAKEGMPSRAEITDAAMGHRAECVMLNKGPYILNAMQVLDDILRRMQEHHAKKRSLMRHLRLADALSTTASSN
jgi:pyruvate kinase